MKLSICAILALCTVVAQGSQLINANNKLEDSSCLPFDGIIDGLPEFIEKGQKEIKKILEYLRERTQKIMEDIEEQVRATEEKIKAVTVKSLNDFKGLLEDIPVKYIEGDKEELDEFSKNAFGLFEKCVSDAIEKGQGILKNVQEHIDGIQDNLNKMDDVIQECWETNESLSKVTPCVAKRTAEIRKEVFGILKHATDALISANKQTVSIVGVAGAEGCLSKIYVDFVKHIYIVTKFLIADNNGRKY